MKMQPNIRYIRGLATTLAYTSEIPFTLRINTTRKSLKDIKLQCDEWMDGMGAKSGRASERLCVNKKSQRFSHHFPLMHIVSLQGSNVFSFKLKCLSVFQAHQNLQQITCATHITSCWQKWRCKNRVRGWKEKKT